MVDLRSSPSLALAWLVVSSPACSRDTQPDTAPKAASAAQTPAKAEAEAKDPPKAETKAAAPACDDARGTELERELTTWCEITHKVLQTDAPLAPWSANPTAPPLGSVHVVVEPEGVSVKGKSVEISGVTDAVDIAIAVAESQARIERRALGRTRWALSIHHNASRSQVAAVLAQLAEYSRDGFVLLATEKLGGPMPTPRKPEVLAEFHTMLEALDDDQRAPKLAEKFDEELPCPEFRNIFYAVGNASPAERCSTLARSVPERWVECGCPEMDEFLTMLYGLSVSTEPPTRLSVSMTTTLDPAAPSRPGATWAEVVAGLDPKAFEAFWVAEG